MATTPNQTKRTVCDYIHSNLQSKLSENQAKTSVKSLSSTRQDNLSAIQAVTAVERAKTNDDYKKNLPPETLTTYARALETFAVKRGIKPEGEDGKFSDDQKTKEFTTENLIYFFSKDLIETASSDEERKSFKDDIDTSIKDIYEDSPIPEPITKSVYNYLSNEMILSMSDEDIKEAISRDPTLANRIDEIKSNNQKELEDSAGRADTMRDPDWGHDKGDDDFKIQDGDIIQYLMKEVILSSAAWATNRVAGTAGTFVYELGSGFHRNVTSPLYKNACDAFGNWWDNLGKDSSLSKEEIEKRKNNFAEALSQCEDSKNILDEFINTKNNSNDENFEGLKDILPNEKPENIEKWINSYKEAIRKNDDSEIKKIKNENPLYFIAFTYGKELSVYKNQADRFSESYAQFLLIEEYRKNQETKVLSDLKKTQEFMERSKLEGRAIFHNKHKERRDPKKKDTVHSIDAMIEEMDGLVEKADGYLKKCSKEKIENPYEKQRPKSKKKCSRIIKAAEEDASIEDVIQGMRESIIREEKELIGRYGENSEKRNKVKEMKERLSKKDKDFKKENPNINPHQYNISGGRKA